MKRLQNSATGVTRPAGRPTWRRSGSIWIGGIPMRTPVGAGSSPSISFFIKRFGDSQRPLPDMAEQPDGHEAKTVCCHGEFQTVFPVNPTQNQPREEARANLKKAEGLHRGTAQMPDVG